MNGVEILQCMQSAVSVNVAVLDCVTAVELLLFLTGH